MINEKKRQELEKQGYRIVGNHSAVKSCLWQKHDLLDRGECYKARFYGVDSWGCVQMTPSLPFCNLRCIWCWRDTKFTLPEWQGPVDEPIFIIENSIKELNKYLVGFKGNKDVNMEKFEKSQNPTNFAISLAGEPTFYPKLPEMVAELRKRKISSFLVTNGTNPKMLERLKQDPPTQLYITLSAPDKETFTECCNPLVGDAWEKLMQSLKILSSFNSRTTVRLTLTKDHNMIRPEKYAGLIRIAQPKFVEVKAYMHVGFSRERLDEKNMPSSQEILDFAEKIAEHLDDYKIVDQKLDSRVALIAKNSDTKIKKI
ncbi:MAG: 4-demethylwyosine synthase TYW1 [Nanoarchaeota archaeon]|nr:4-demethylwyosine synthase TYW1 [Nanoarchaeota archaeon]